MAFRFFRKRQKMVIIIMVVLMVSFLIGFQGFSMFCDTRGGKAVIGTVGGTKIRAIDQQQARTSLDLLREYIRLDRPVFTADGPKLPPTGEDLLTFIALNDAGNTAGVAHLPLAYLLLQHEADEMDIEVGDAEVQAFLGQIMTELQLETLRERLKSESKLAFHDLERVLKRWLKVHRAFDAAAANSPASELQTRTLFKDLNEKIDLRVARIAASDFLKDVKTPTDGQIQAHYTKYKAYTPGKRDDDNPFGFGYKQPNEVAISYLLVRRDVLERVCRPSEKKLMDYYREHEKEFKRPVWSGAGQAAETFLKALVDGDMKAATAMVKSGTPAQKQVTSLKGLAAVRKAALQRAVQSRDGKAALAETDPVRTADGRVGSLLVQLARGGDTWQVTDCDVKPAAAVGEARAEFEKKHKDSENITATMEQMRYSQAEEDIVTLLSGDEVAKKIEDVANSITTKLSSSSDRGQWIGKDPYEWIISTWTRPADDLLKTVISAKRAKAIRGTRLEDAIKALTEAAGVGTICYPWGDQGTISIDPSIRVTIDVPANGTLTLGEALAQIDAQIPALEAREATPQPAATTQPATRPTTQPTTQPATQPASRPAAPTTRPAGPRLKWVTCRGFQIAGHDVLFPVDGPGGLAVLPIRAGKTELLSRDELQGDPLLGSAGTSQTGRGGDTLVAAAFSVKEFQSDKRRGSGARAEVGREGARMFVQSSDPGSTGVLLWRVSKAVPAFSPQSPDDVPGLRDKVIADLRMKMAFAMAEKMGRELASTPDDLKFEEEAKARDLKTTDTGLFARKEHRDVRMMYLWLFRRYPQQGNLLLKAILERPHEFPASRPAGVNLADEKQCGDFIEKVFTLVPPPGATPPAPPSKKLVYPLPNDRSVLVVQRIAYTPPVEGKYQDSDPNGEGRVGLQRALGEVQEWQYRQRWFAFDQIVARVGFKFDEEYTKRAKDAAAQGEED